MFEMGIYLCIQLQTINKRSLNFFIHYVPGVCISMHLQKQTNDRYNIKSVFKRRPPDSMCVHI